jgi:ribosomal protein S18 acetylase RimI-like enzyme
MEISLAGKTDIDGINRLLRQVLDIHHAGRPDLFRVGAKKYTDAQLEALFCDPDRPIFLAKSENGEVLGYAFCILQQIGNEILTDIRSLYIDDLCVDETVRGQKIGKALYDHVCAYAKAIGCYNVTLNVWACNESARRFYEKLGMQIQKIGMETIL